MKNKKTVFGTVILLFALIGICSIPNVSADTVKIPPLSYVYYRTNTLEYRDEIDIYISSSGTINVYIMNAEQFSTLTGSLGLIWEYCMKWKDTTYVDYSFSISENGMYYVVLYNKALLTTRTVYTKITIDYYEPISGVDEDTKLLAIILYVGIPAIIISISIILSRRFKRIKKEMNEKISDIQEKRVPTKVYCRECGNEILDKSKMFCSTCGTKIIN